MENGISNDSSDRVLAGNLDDRATRNYAMQASSGTIILADHLAIIEANHKAFMVTILRVAALTVSSVLLIIIMAAHYYFAYVGKEAPMPPEVIMGFILTSFSGELYVRVKDAITKKD